MIIDGETYACAVCTRGHRAASCKHTDRPLQQIARKGRPVSQCHHCRTMRASRSAHVKCTCATQTASSSDSTSCLCFTGAPCVCAHKMEKRKRISPAKATTSSYVSASGTSATQAAQNITTSLNLVANATTSSATQHADLTGDVVHASGAGQHTTATLHNAFWPDENISLPDVDLNLETMTAFQMDPDMQWWMPPPGQPEVPLNLDQSLPAQHPLQSVSTDIADIPNWVDILDLDHTTALSEMENMDKR